MKNVVVLFLFLLFCQASFSENPSPRFMVNLSLSAPLYRSDTPQFKLYPDPGWEGMVHFRIFRGVHLGTGFGMEYGHHIMNREFAYIAYVDGKPNKYQGSYNYHLKFTSLEIPVELEFRLGIRIISAFTVGVQSGWHSKIRFWLDNASLMNEPELDRFYVEPNVRLNFPVKKLKHFSFDLQPLVSRKFYTTHRNVWQKNSYFIGINLKTNIGGDGI